MNVPVVIDAGEDGTYRLTERGTIGDTAANVGAGYFGTHTIRAVAVAGVDAPLMLGTQVPRKHARAKLRSGEWKVMPDAVE